jgi:hypothetical protein
VTTARTCERYLHAGGIAFSDRRAHLRAAFGGPHKRQAEKHAS